MQLCKRVQVIESVITFYVTSANKSQIRPTVNQQAQFSIPASPMQLTRYSSTASAKQTLLSKPEPILSLSSNIILTRLRWNTTVTNCTACTVKAMGSHTNASSNAQPGGFLANVQAVQKILCNVTGQVSPSQINGRIAAFVNAGQLFTATFESPLLLWNMTLLSAPIPAKRRRDTADSLPNKCPLGALALDI
jgi:hypothetical protein